MKTRKCFRIIPRFVAVTFCLLTMAMLFWSCDRLKGITTIYGMVTAPGYGPVDSAKIYFVARQSISKTKFVAEAFTDKNGEYHATVDAPRGYGRIECGLALGDTPSTTQYRVYEAWQEGKKLKTCCGVTAGWKANFDFKLFK